mmetsp:Transcript_21720/g.32332  ORF Transcript_21720/g.32332 Transcript_21720/m.32332 type:complete len:83 (+) Transcript_21720:306-554(+)
MFLSKAVQAEQETETADEVLTIKYYIPLDIECSEQLYKDEQHPGLTFLKVKKDGHKDVYTANLEFIGKHSNSKGIKNPNNRV